MISAWWLLLIVPVAVFTGFCGFIVGIKWIWRS